MTLAADKMAERVEEVRSAFGHDWISARNYARHYHTSVARASMTLRHLWEQGVVTRAELISVGLDVRENRGLRWAYRLSSKYRGAGEA